MNLRFNSPKGIDNMTFRTKGKTINFHAVYEMSIELKEELDVLSSEIQTKSFSLYIEQGNLMKIIKLQRFFRAKNRRKDFFSTISKIIKSLKYRRNIIFELLKTEENFINNLDLILINLVFPLRNNCLSISEDTLKMLSSLFSNIEPIRNFNEKLFKKLSFLLKSYHHNVVFGNIMLEFLPFFKLYYFYCNEFEKNSAMIMKIRSDVTNPEYKIITKWLSSLEYTPALKNLDLNSMLVMPVQRLPKYVLLFKDLLKHTAEYHPDHKNIKKCLDIFIEINQENNQKMNMCLKNLKILQLQNTYGSDNLVILDPKREFCAEETLGLIMNNVNTSVICYFLSDMILVTERSNEISHYKLLHHVILVDDSFIKDLPNTKYFSNLFSVNGSNISLTFSAENLDAKFKFFSLINDIISKIKDKQENKRKLLKQASNLLSHELVMSKMISNNIPLNVSAIGTEERNYSTIDRYTVYIIVIELNDFSQRIYLRYSEIVDLYDIVRKQFPKINIPKIARNHWFTYRKTKIIESRKMLIENFLQMLLKNENVINDCAKILSFLNLPLDLYDVHLKNLKLSNPNELDLSASVASSNLLTKYLSFSKSNIITDNLIEGFDESKSDDGQIKNSLVGVPNLIHSRNFLTPNKKSSSIIIKNQRKKVRRKWKEMSNIEGKNFSKEITIHFVDDSSTTLNITVNTTAEDAVEKIAQQINLTNFLDFRLFLIDQYNNKKMIDEDELLFKFFCNDKSFQKIKWEFDSHKMNRFRENSEKMLEEDKNQNKSIFYQMRKSISQYFSLSQIFNKEKNLKVVFKKYFYLDQTLEKEDFLEDPVRAKLLAFQIFTDIENFKFQMRSHDYILLTALYIFINYGDYLIYKDNCNFLKFLSKTPYFLNRLKKYPSWTTHVSHAWEKISKDIETISKKKLNSSPSKNEKFGWETDERETCEKSQKVIKSSTFIFGIDRLSELPKIKDNLKNFKAILACYTVIHMFENNEIYGSELYWIETYNHSTTNLPKYMTLGVNFTGLSFLSLSDKKVIKKIGFSDIFEAISQPKSLLLRLKNENYRFNTFKSFEICQIIEEYKLFRKVYHLEE